jgi:hypothetical protein
MGLNELFDEVCVLNVDRRVKDFPRIESMLQDVGWTKNINRFVVGKGDVLPEDEYSRIDDLGCSNKWNCAGYSNIPNSYHAFKSFQAIIGKAYTDNINSILILEDDCQFTPNFKEVLEKAESDILISPKWDMLYLGANHTWHTTESAYKGCDNLLKLSGSLCWHAVGLNKSVFPTILSWDVDRPIDLKAQVLHRHCNCYSVWPSIATQKPGYSYVEGRERNYDEFFESKGTNWK